MLLIESAHKRDKVFRIALSLLIASILVVMFISRRSLVF